MKEKLLLGECCGCAAGIFSAPVCLPTFAELFERHSALDNLQAFVSDNAQRIHNFKPPAKQVKLEKVATQVPQKYGEVVPYRAGDQMSWSVTSVE